jgi:hypothetical protein
VSGVHTQLGYVTVAINLLAALIGGGAWLAHRNPQPFWWALRAGQILVMLEAVIGAALSLTGHDLPRLHLIYGLTPIAVSFLAEQLRLVTTPTFLERRGLSGGDDVRKLPEAEQRALVDAILQRELAVMATSAAVVAALCARAALLL